MNVGPNVPFNLGQPQPRPDFYGWQQASPMQAATGPVFRDANGNHHNLDMNVVKHFGMPQYGDPRVNPYGPVSKAYETFPEAFGGPHRARNNHLEIVILQITMRPERPISSEIFPLVYDMDGSPKYHVTQLTYHDAELDRVPELGVPRLMTSSSSSWVVNVPRYGIGLFMEHGFAMTEVGMRQYAMSMQQIRNSIWDTIDREAFGHMLMRSPSAGQIDFFWKHFGAPLGPDATIDQVFNYECQMFGILNRAAHGYTLVIDRAKHVMARKGIKPTVALGPHGCKNLIGRREELSTFSQIGEVAKDAQGKDDGNFNIYNGRGIRLIEAELVNNYRNDEWALPEDPLMRTRVIGTFFQMNQSCRMIAKTVWDPAHGYVRHGAAVTPYRSEFANITVHDNDTDQMVTITLAEAVRNCAFSVRLWAAIVAHYRTRLRLPLRTVGELFEAMQAEAGNPWTTDELNAVMMAITNAAAAPGARAALCDDVNLDDTEALRTRLIGLVNQNIVLPFNFLIMRPFERRQMGSMIFTVLGGKAGFTSIGQLNFQITHDGIRKYMTGTFTANIGVVVTNPDAIHVAHNVMYGPYENGGGVQFFHPIVHQHEFGQFHVSENGQYSRSLLVAPIPMTTTLRAAHIDITGKFVDSETELHYPTAEAFADYWSMRPTPVANLVDTKYFDSEGANGLNTRLAQGHQLMWGLQAADSATPNAVQMVGRGHHGMFTYAGVNADRVGSGTRRSVLTETPYDKVPFFM